MATIGNKAAQRKLDLAKAQKNAHAIGTKTTGAKNRVIAGARLSNEAKCLLLVQSGKGYKSILSHCKSVYADKVLPATTDKSVWIASRAKIYLTIAQKQDSLLKQDAANNG